MPDGIPGRQLQPADVLLYRGHDWLARAIQFFDGTEVNHAGLVSAPDTVIEALGKGLERRDVATSYGRHDWVMARRLKTPLDMTPVTARADALFAEGHRYAYGQLLLLAFLGLTRKLAPSPVLRVLLRGVLDRAAEWLEQGLAGGKQPMICSEFVFRCYDEARPEPDDPFTLHINVLPAPAAATRVIAAATARAPKGRGMHAESLLAWATSPAIRTRIDEVRMARPARGRRPRRVSDRELEALFERYAEGVRKPRRAGARRAAAVATDAVDSTELLAAVDRFAVAYHHAAHRLRKSGRFVPAAAESVAATGAAPMRTVLDAVADFVTPGDLLHCESLMTLGKIEL
jgi:hypothetical protein